MWWTQLPILSNDRAGEWIDVQILSKFFSLHTQFSAINLIFLAVMFMLEKRKSRNFHMKCAAA